MLHKFDELLVHVGHKIECIHHKNGCLSDNITIECITCGTIIVDLSPNLLLSRKVEEEIGTTIFSTWSIDDVEWRANERNIKLSKKQCKEILFLIDKNQNADSGINWSVLDYFTDVYLNKMSKV